MSKRTLKPSSMRPFSSTTALSASACTSMFWISGSDLSCLMEAVNAARLSFTVAGSTGSTSFRFGSKVFT